MTYLRYFVPLVIEGNKRNIKSVFFVGRTGKYNCPLTHKKTLEKLANTYNFELRDISQIKDNGYPFFLIEGVFCDLLNNFKSKKYSMTYMTDYVGVYEKYIDSVDHVIFPSKFIADHYDKKSQKNLYLGSPKYDITFDSNEIYKKYNINPSGKKAFVVLPRSRDIGKIDFDTLYGTLRESGYDIITKTRGKDPFSQEKICGDYHFMDFSWFPHDSMELMYISDLAINFSSTSIKEMVILKKPLINIHIKPFDLSEVMKFLYEYEYCENFIGGVSKEELQSAINRLEGKQLDDEFDKSIEAHLFTGNSSKRILDFLEL
jgi:hypothetical protein